MDLVTLTAAARQAATQYEHLERSTVEARREQAVEYGRALSQIRQLIPGDRAFAQHLDANGLTVPALFAVKPQFFENGTSTISVTFTVTAP